MSGWLVAKTDGSDAVIVQAKTARAAFEKASESFNPDEIRLSASRWVWRLGGFPTLFNAFNDGSKTWIDDLGRPDQSLHAEVISHD